MIRKPRITSKSYSSKKSEASKKGWMTRRKNQNSLSQKSTSKPTRAVSMEKLKKLQQAEKTRNFSRLKAQKKGKSLVSDKPKLKLKKPVRTARKQSKKRVSIR